jgi:hypothetical protein
LTTRWIDDIQLRKNKIGNKRNEKNGRKKTLPSMIESQNFTLCCILGLSEPSPPRVPWGSPSNRGRQEVFTQNYFLFPVKKKGNGIETVMFSDKVKLYS